MSEHEEISQKLIKNEDKYHENLISLERIFFKGNNISPDLILNYYERNFPYSFNLIICQLMYSSIVSQRLDFNTYTDCLKSIESYETEFDINSKIIKVFGKFLLGNQSQESNYILENMIEQKLIHPNFVQKKFTYFFSHLKNKEETNYLRYHPFEDRSAPFFVQFNSNINELIKDDWKMHKQFIHDEVNPNELSKIIRNDEIEKLQKLSTSTKFDFNKKIKPSLYERCSFVNHENVTLIDYAAFFGSIKCFRFLLLNESEVINGFKYAIAGGNVEIIHLCEQNHSSFDGTLETAIEFHRNEIFHYLYENNIFNNKDLNELGKICVEHNNYEILSFLEDEGMNIENSIINLSAKCGNIFLVKHFLKSHQVPENILLFSAESGNFELFKYVIEQEGYNVNYKDENGNTAFMIACQEGNINIVKLLLEQKGININTKNNHKCTGFMIACMNGHYEIVSLLLNNIKNKINVKSKDENRNTALDYACAKGYLDIAKLLLDQKKININHKNKKAETALILASFNGQLEVVKLLLQQKKMDINARNSNERTALMLASSNGHVDIVKILLAQNGIDVEAKDNVGITAFMYACRCGKYDVMKYFIENEKIDFNLQDKFGNTALIYASKIGYVNIVQLLLEQKEININIKSTEWGRVAFMYACYYGHTDVVKLFLKRKECDINAKDFNDVTALMIASHRNKIDVAKLLLDQKNIEINVKNNEGKTALSIATEDKNTEIEKLLLSKGAI